MRILVAFVAVLYKVYCTKDAPFFTSHRMALLSTEPEIRHLLSWLQQRSDTSSKWDLQCKCVMNLLSGAHNEFFRPNTEVSPGAVDMRGHNRERGTDGQTDERVDGQRNGGDRQMGGRQGLALVG